MEEDLNEISSTEQKKKSYSDIFHELAPWYISIGMTYEQYWDGEAEMCADYRHAHEYKQIEKNRELWIQGRYFYEAISTAMYNAFRKKGVPAEDYAKEPYPINRKMQKDQKAQKEKESVARILGFMKRNLQKQNKSKGNGE